MSHWRAQLADIEEPADLVAFVGDYYHVPTILSLLVFMLWSRVRNWKNFIVDGKVFFSGNDPWYHYRSTKYVVQHWPQTMPFDPWTHFPFGTNSSQFGTIFDQFMATIALIVGLGNPSDQTIRMVMLFTPAVIGTATAIPVYYMGRRAGGRLGAVTAVGVLALVGSIFASRGSVGFPDHQIMEAFLQATAVLATMVAVSVAQEEKPIYELFEERNWNALRRPVGWAMLAGVAIAFYIWAWPPGVLILGILGLFYLFELCIEYLRGESPEHVAITGAISLTTAGVLTMASLEQIALQPTAFSALQPGLAFAVAGGCVFMAWLAREWDARDLAAWQYPALVFGIIFVLAGGMRLLLPDLFGFFVNQTMRVVGLSVSARAGTIGEAQPLALGALWVRYRFTIFLGSLGAIYVIAKLFIKRVRAEFLLLVIWGVIILLATLTQRRFEYYLAAPVAILTGLLLGQFASFVNLDATGEDIEAYQVITVFAVLLLVVAPLVYPSVLAMQSTRAGVTDSPKAWNQSLDWMQENTPPIGEYGGHNNSLDYYGTYEKTDDFAYQNGSYGVLSWWDYGHWITVMGERIPVANPFQQGATQAANFLLSTNESHALDVLDRLEENNETETKYVMIDWKMVQTDNSIRVPGRQPINLNGKYFAPFSFYNDGDINPRNYYWGYRSSYGLFYETGSRALPYRSFSLRKENYYRSTAVRLYHFHGSAIRKSRVVVDWKRQTVQGSTLRVSNGTLRFNTTAQAEQYIQNDPTSQIGGVGAESPVRVEAMEHFRLVQVSNKSALSSRRYALGLRKVARGALQTRATLPGGAFNPRVIGALHQTRPAWVKVFEKVPGATVKGTGPANATVQASVQLRVPGSNSTFVYRQRAKTGEDGQFTMTLPYSTKGYEKMGVEEGYTAPRVRATGPYLFRATTQNESGYTLGFSGKLNVSERAVVTNQPDPLSVTLEQTIAIPPVSQNQNQTSSGNSTDGGSSGAGSGEGSGSGGNSGSGSDSGDSGNGTSGDLTAPIDPRSTVATPFTRGLP